MPHSISKERQASVVIVTRNRKDDLAIAIESALGQTVAPEVIVIDDGSTDATFDFVRGHFPSVRLITHQDCRGLVVRRNEGARLAEGSILFSIDDDAAFSTPRVVEMTLEDFSSERVGAVAIPYINVNRDGRIYQTAPDPHSIYVTESFIGTSHAVRRDLFLTLGGYRDYFVHQGEEGDFCARMLNAGYVVRLGNAEPIHHFESPKRDLRRMDFYGARNAILFAWENVPFPYVLAHLPVTTLRALLLTLQRQRFRTRLSGVMEGYSQCRLRRRQPITSTAYRLVRSLRRRGATPLRELRLKEAAF